MKFLRFVFCSVFVAATSLNLSVASAAEPEKKSPASEDKVEARAIETSAKSDDIDTGKNLTVNDVQKVENRYLQHYKPVYFAYGNPLTKAQFSFKSQIYADVPVYMAYSQIIFWELTKDSKPFLDGTYNPEIFYTYKFGDGYLRTIDFGIWEHNSNGKGGLDSRSYDQSNVRLNYVFEGKKWITEFAMKLKYIYNNDETNRDIYDYISPFEFQVKVLNIFDSFLDHTELTLDFHPGGKYGHNWDNSGYQLGLQFHIGGIKVVPAFYLQYYSGYAETLINYNDRVSEFRAGIAF